MHPGVRGGKGQFFLKHYHQAFEAWSFEACLWLKIYILQFLLTVSKHDLLCCFPKISY
jgi:hypothetical protein